MDSASLATKPTDFKTDKRRVDRFEPEIKRILGEIFIKTAPKRLDMEEATDMLVLEVKPFRIGCRVRRNKYYIDPYKYEFTIRNERPSGRKSEMQKIMRGDIDYTFYAFADEEDENVLSYVVGDLKVFREAFWFEETRKKIKFERHTNKDKSSDFYCFDWRTLPGAFAIKETITTDIPF